MSKCAVCDETILDTNEGLCYLHMKYLEQITGPYFETLYDLLWWKATFLKEWDEQGLGRIKIGCADIVHVHKMNVDMVEKCKAKIALALNAPGPDLMVYEPLAHKMAYGLSATSTVDKDDLFGQGMMYLKVLENKISPDLESKAISAWVKRGLYGAMCNYINNVGSVVKVPQDATCERVDIEADQILDDADDVEQRLLEAISGNVMGMRLFDLFELCTERQQKILTNYCSIDRLSQAGLATKLGVSQKTISTEMKIIMQKAEDM